MNTWRSYASGSGRIPARYLIVSRPAALPGQWDSRAWGPLRRMTDRKATATMIASSAYPMTGRKSGMRSIGTIRYAKSRWSRIRTRVEGCDQRPGGGSARGVRQQSERLGGVESVGRSMISIATSASHTRITPPTTASTMVDKWSDTCVHSAPGASAARATLRLLSSVAALRWTAHCFGARC